MATTLTPRTAVVMIYQGDDLEQLAHLHRAATLEEEQQKHGKSTALRIGDAVPGSRTARDAYNGAVEEAAERAVAVRMNALGRIAFRALLAEHTPREGSKTDEQAGYNEDTFPRALLLDSVVEPDMSHTARGAFLDELADGDFDKLFMTAYTLNRAAGRDPKDARFFVDTPSSDETFD